MPGQPASELSQLAFVVGAAIFAAIVAAVLSRLLVSVGIRVRAASEPGTERTTSPRMFYAAIGLCTLAGGISVLDGRTLFATVFFVLASTYAVALALQRARSGQ